MIRINPNYSKLSSSYLFSEVSRRVAAFKAERAGEKVISMGVGDVTLPLTPAVVQAFRHAAEEMGKAETFRGYPPELGYDFLRNAIAENDFRSRGAEVSPEEIVISDGAKSDTANIQELFDGDIRIAIPDPVYPVYVDTNVMAGRTGPYRDGRYGGLIYLDCTEDNGFIPDPPRSRVDLIYLCFPNNPTGAAIDRARLTAWVDYARAAKALILYDAAYVAYIRDESLPHSIYEIPGCAGMRHRVSKLLQDRRLHRYALRVHRGAQNVQGLGCGGQGTLPARPVVPAPVNEVQRSFLPGTARRCGHLYPGGEEGDARPLGLLPGQRRDRSPQDGCPGIPLRRRGQFPVHLGKNPPGFVELLRSIAEEGGGRGHPGQRVRQLRGRIRADKRVQSARAR